MFCPNCQNLIKKGVLTCNECGFDKNKLKTASHQDVTKARRQARFNDVIYYDYYPNDFDYDLAKRKTMLLGITGFHNFFLKKPVRGTVLSLMFGYLFVYLAFIPQERISEYNEVILGFIATLMLALYIFDVIKIFRRKLKIPIVLNQRLRK